MAIICINIRKMLEIHFGQIYKLSFSQQYLRATVLKCK